MNIRSIKLVYFSPTGTSKKIILGIARGMGYSSIEMVDITLPEARKQPLSAAAEDLLVVAVPVYAGRVPGFLQDWLASIKADKTPTVCLAVYGNRAVDDALLELNDILCASGCVPVAGGEFIGEHSFSTDDTPIAVSRPDAEDLRKAEELGQLITRKLKESVSLDQASGVSFPGNRPYRANKPFAPGEFFAIDSNCTRCGVCESVCPVHAIDLDAGILIDYDACIACCACIKSCPEHVRSMKESPLKDVAHRLASTCNERKEPVFYI